MAQNAVVQFAETVFLTTRTALTQWADTSYATTEIVAWATANVPALLPVAQTWALLQYYFGGIRVATVNPLTVGGTLAIGNGATANVVKVMTAFNTGILTLGSSGSTTSLNTSMTPNYIYSPMPFALPNNGSGTYGTVGRIGTTYFARSSNFYVPAGQLSDANWFIMFGIVQITLPVGVWFLNGEVANQGGTNSTALGICFNDTNRFSPNVAPASFTNVGAFAKKYFFLGNTTFYTSTISATYTVTTGTKQIWLQYGSGGYGFFNGPCYFTATRIA
jgi:hypothetical protein